ncbi:MAG: hypothetical protein KDG57_14460, partial [Rhodoferax sp.]|nr:hypothetical protein [Rhodoferax sp.]
QALLSPLRGLAALPEAAKSLALTLGVAGLSATVASLAVAGAWPLAALAAVANVALLGLIVANTRRVVQALNCTARRLDAFSQARFDGVIEARGHDECAQALLALKRVQTRLGFEVADTARRAAESEQRRREEEQVAGEVNRAVQAATGGNLQQRIPLEGKNAFFTELCSGFNQLLDTVSGTIR